MASPGPRRYVVRTFGCQMNEHDSERIAGLLDADGLVAVDDVADADVVVLNTCCIRENADNKLYGTPRPPEDVEGPSATDARSSSPGCLAQKDRDDRPPAGAVRRRRARHAQRAPRRRRCSATPAATGPVTEIFDDAVLDDHDAFPSALPGPAGTSYNAWVTIQIGCDNSCAFCIVPAVRGAEISRPFADDRRRGRGASPPHGVTEVTLLGQNVNSYGRDLQLAARRSGDVGARAPAVRRAARAPSAPSTASGASGSPARTRRTCAPRRSRRWPGRPPSASTSTTRCSPARDRVLAAMHRGYTADRYLDRLAEARRRRRRPRRVDRHHRRLPRRDRRRLRARRSRSPPQPSTTTPTRSSSRPGPAPRRRR